MGTFYVSQSSGSDSHSSLQAQNTATPWKTISHAFYVAGASPGGNGSIIEIIDNETYVVSNGSVGAGDTSNQITATTGHIPNPFTIRAGDGFNPILDGQYSATHAFDIYSNWLIEGIEFYRFGTNSNDRVIGEVSGRRTGKVFNCTFHGITGSAIGITNDGCEMRRNLIYDVNNFGIYGFESMTCINNVIYDVDSVGIYGGFAGSHADTLIAHNTIYNTPRSGSTASNRNYAIYAANMYYNVVVDAGANLYGIRNAQGSHEYNCVTGTYDPSGGYSPTNYYGGPDTGDIETDPLFVNKAGNDFTLTPESPCVGTANGSSVPKDFVSGSRDWEYSHKVMGINTAPTHDMGAYEITHTKVNATDTQLIQKVLGVSR